MPMTFNQNSGNPPGWEDYNPEEDQAGVTQPSNPEGWEDYNPEEDANAELTQNLIRAKEESNKVLGLVGDVAAGALYEGPRRILDLANAGASAILPDFLDPNAERDRFLASQGKEPSTGVPYSEIVQSVTGDPNKEAFVSPTAVELGATLGPSMGGAGAASKVLGKVITDAPKWATWMARTLGASVGYAGSKTPAADRMLVGESQNTLTGLSALFPIFEGFDEIDENGKRNRLNTFLNDTMDAMAIAYPAERAAVLVGKVGGLVNNTILKPVAKFFTGQSGEAMEDMVVRQFVHMSRLADNAQSPQERAAILRQMGNYMKEHEEVLFKMGDDDVRVMRDTVSALEEAMKGRDIPGGSAVVDRAKSLRAGAINQAKGGELAERISAPSAQTEEMLAVTEAQKGGKQAIDTAAKGIQEQAQKNFQDVAEGPLRAKEAELDIAASNVDEAFRGDSALADHIARLDENVSVNISNAKDETAEVLADKVEQGFKEMNEKFTQLVDEIPEGVEINFDDALDEFPELADVLPRYKKYINVEGDDAGNLVSITGDFKDLYKRLVPKLNKDIDLAVKTPGNPDTDKLINLREIITSKVPDVPEAAAFHDWFKNTWAPIWKDGKLKEFARLYRTTKGRGIQDVDYKTGRNEIIKGSLESDPYFTEHLNKLTNDPKLSTDYYLQNAASKIQSRLNAGKDFTEIDISDITSSLEKYGANLKKTNPEELKRVNDFLTKLRNKKGDVKKLTAEIDELSKAKDKTERQIFEKDYKEFHEGVLKPKLGSGYESFDTLLTNKENSNKIQAILDQAKAEGRTDIIKGTQAAYLRFLKKKIFSQTNKLPGGAKQMKSEYINDVFEEANHTLDYGKQIFADEPKAMELIQSMVKEGKRLQDSVGGITATSMDDAIKILANQASSGLDRMITLTFGVLNRYAARARSLKGMALQSTEEGMRKGTEYTPGNMLNVIIDRFYADPKYAAKLLERVAREDAQVSSPEMKRLMYDWIVFQLPGGDPKEIQKAVDATFEDVNDTDQQTKEAFK